MGWLYEYNGIAINKLPSTTIQGEKSAAQLPGGAANDFLLGQVADSPARVSREQHNIGAISKAACYGGLSSWQ
jgi:hypothetical protein